LPAAGPTPRLISTPSTANNPLPLSQLPSPKSSAFNSPSTTTDQTAASPSIKSKFSPYPQLPSMPLSLDNNKSQHHHHQVHLTSNTKSLQAPPLGLGLAQGKQKHSRVSTHRPQTQVLSGSKDTSPADPMSPLRSLLVAKQSNAQDQTAASPLIKSKFTGYPQWIAVTRPLYHVQAPELCKSSTSDSPPLSLITIQAQDFPRFRVDPSTPYAMHGTRPKQITAKRGDSRRSLAWVLA
jgi:hypothetical protein